VLGLERGEVLAGGDEVLFRLLVGSVALSNVSANRFPTLISVNLDLGESGDIHGETGLFLIPRKRDTALHPATPLILAAGNLSRIRSSTAKTTSVDFPSFTNRSGCVAAN
jgi:hypothetical protein